VPRRGWYGWILGNRGRETIRMESNGWIMRRGGLYVAPCGGVHFVRLTLVSSFPTLPEHITSS
jgi:hypothetical protein